MNPPWWTELRGSLPAKLEHLRVGIYATAGAPYHHGALATLWGAEPRMVSAEEILQGELDGLDVIVFPGGGLSAMGGMLEPLTPDGAAKVRDWVAGGGMYIGSCAGSFLPAAVAESFRAANPASREMFMVRARLANSADSGWEGLTSPGVGALEVEVYQEQHWLTEGLPQQFQIVHYNGPVFVTDCPLESFRAGDPTEPATGVIRFIKATPQFTSWENTLSQSADPDINRYVEQGCYSVVTASYAKGTVVLFGSHPEFGFNAIQLGWGPACRLFANALVYQASQRTSDRKIAHTQAQNPKHLRVQLTESGRQLKEQSIHFERLSRAAGQAIWLEPGYAPGFQGLTPREVWRRSLEDAATACQQTALYLERLTDCASDQDLIRCQTWINQRERGLQDYGFVGLVPLIEKMVGLIRAGEAKLEIAPFQPASPYDAWFEHPYHLLTSTYLSATGLAACVTLCAVIIGTVIDSKVALPGALVVETGDATPA